MHKWLEDLRPYLYKKDDDYSTLVERGYIMHAMLSFTVRVMTRVMIFHTNHYKTLRVRDPCTRKATKDDIMLDSGTHLKVL